MAKQDMALSFLSTLAKGRELENSTSANITGFNLPLATMEGFKQLEAQLKSETGKILDLVR